MGTKTSLLTGLVRVALIALAFVCSPANADKRVALVLGNSDYRNAPSLKNSSNDAEDIAAALARVGFEIVHGINLDYALMREQVRIFAEKLVGADVGLFFYAGHGLQIAGKNYLVPVDARLASTADLDFGTIDFELVMRSMEREARTNIVLLDACRDNPLAQNLARSMGTRSALVSRGLAQVETGVGTLIAFATQPGNVALDGQGRNSPFTSALLNVIEKPGVPLSDIMISVRNEVLRQTNNKQVPWDHSSLTGQFYFVPPEPAAATATAGSSSREEERARVEIAFWDTVKNEKNPRLFEAYLRRYPDGGFADIARITLEDLKAGARTSALSQPDDKVAISDATLAKEVRERLYELNFDPGPPEGPLTEATRGAIREFQRMSSLEVTGNASMGLLRRLREIGGLKPWGSIVYAPAVEKWGMSWGHPSRKDAVVDARSSCGIASKCTVEVSYFGTECGAFAHSGSVWAIVARDSIQRAKEAALADCQKAGKGCRIIAAVCADGAERTGANK
jgi:hypothetical protein